VFEEPTGTVIVGGAFARAARAARIAILARTNGEDDSLVVVGEECIVEDKALEAES
jgi:hypothetical protein